MDFDEWHLNTYSLRWTAYTVTIKIHSSGCWVNTGFEKSPGLQKKKALLLQPEAGEGCKISCAHVCCWSSVQCREQGEPQLLCAVPGDAQPCQPSHLSKAKQALSWGRQGLLLQQGGADTSGLLPMELWKGRQSLIPPWHGCAGTAASRDTIPSAVFPFGWLGLIYSDYKQCQEKGTLSVLWAHLAAAAHAPEQLFCCRWSFAGKEAPRREPTLFKLWWLSQNWRKLSLNKNIVLGSSLLRVFLLARLKEGSNPRSGEKRRKTTEASI